MHGWLLCWIISEIYFYFQPTQSGVLNWIVICCGSSQDFRRICWSLVQHLNLVSFGMPLINVYIDVHICILSFWSLVFIHWLVGPCTRHPSCTLNSDINCNLNLTTTLLNSASATHNCRGKTPDTCVRWSTEHIHNIAVTVMLSRWQPVATAVHSRHLSFGINTARVYRYFVHLDINILCLSDPVNLQYSYH